MSTKSSKIWYAIKHNPTLVPILIKDTSIPNGMIYSILRKAIPCRVGIEFELSGSFTKGFIGENRKLYKFLTIKDAVKSIKSKYHFIDYKDDFDSKRHEYITDYTALNEVRVSIDSFKSLTGLYQFMNDLNKYCRLITTGGIHIHIDFHEYIKDKELLKKIIIRHLSEVENIFPKYTGKYNKRKVGIREKSTYVNISRLDTLEFRIAPLTFDYPVLMDWIIKLIKLRNLFIRELRSYRSINKTSVKFEKLPEESQSLCNYVELPITRSRVLSSYGANINNYSEWTNYEFRNEDILY